MSRLFGIAGIQMEVVAWDEEATIAKMRQIIHSTKMSFPWVQMLVFHELCPSGLVQFDAKPDPETWKRIVQAIPGTITDALCQIAKGENIWLIPGSMYEQDGDKIYNTALAISPEGKIVAKYRKIFPWYPLEAETVPGNEFCVFDIPDVGRFGLTICYDMWFPEVVRALVWQGAEVILHPTMTPTSDRDIELVLSQANAIMNQCYFIDINGVGPWGGGKSMLVDPDGRILQQAGTNETILTEIIDLDKVTQTREFGTLGLAQTLKQMGQTDIQFPQYQNHFGTGRLYETLGKVQQVTNLKTST
ncbi:MAG: nitrilase-related carbon-nitrogen hydrolase [Anaerolineae bacterium]|nr:nitrilase-related carbon-nitrogen hydrolase [Anaerolineae bacterium]